MIAFPSSIACAYAAALSVLTMTTRMTLDFWPKAAEDMPSISTSVATANAIFLNTVKPLSLIKFLAGAENAPGEIHGAARAIPSQQLDCRGLYPISRKSQGAAPSRRSPSWPRTQHKVHFDTVKFAPLHYPHGSAFHSRAASATLEIGKPGRRPS